MKPVIETLSYALRTRLHRPRLFPVDGGPSVLRCEHCAPIAPEWPCSTIELIGAVLRGEA